MLSDVFEFQAHLFSEEIIYYNERSILLLELHTQQQESQMQ